MGCVVTILTISFGDFNLRWTEPIQTRLCRGSSLLQLLVVRPAPCQGTRRGQRSFREGPADTVLAMRPVWEEEALPEHVGCSLV